jgi:hypothetical protein
MAGAGIENDEGRLCGVDSRAGGRHDPDQHVIDWFVQRAAVAHDLKVELKYVGGELSAPLQGGVAALAQCIKREDCALTGVDAVVLHEVGILAREHEGTP